MQFVIKQSILAQSLARANRVIEKRQANPILGCVLFETVDEGIRITSTNMDMTVIDIVPCDTSKPGQYCLSAGLLYDIVKKLPSNSDIIFDEIGDNTVHVTSNKTSFSIHYIDSSDYPPISLIEYTAQFNINVKSLKSAINIAKVAMSQDVSRIQLNGIYIHYENNTVRFASTDLFRISCVSIPAPETVEKISPIIISRKTVTELLHLLDDINESETISIKINNNKIAFEAYLKNSVKSIYSSRLVSGSFPEYKTAIDIINDKLLTVNTKDLINALDRVSTIVSDTSNSIKLSICNNKLLINGISRELGSASEELEIEFNGESSLEICFNSKYLLDLIKQISSTKTHIYLNNCASPTIIKPADTNGAISTIFVIMPIEVIQS